MFFRGQAKPNKKAKLNKPVNDPNPSEPEKQQPESSHPIADNIVDDLPPESHNVDLDPMNANPGDTNPPSPTRTASRVKPAGKDDDVTITIMASQPRVVLLPYPGTAPKKKFLVRIKASGR